MAASKQQVAEPVRLEVDAAEIEQAVRPHLEEIERLNEQNRDMSDRFQRLFGEYTIMKSDCEIIKTKARQLLIEKDKEIEKLKSQRGIKE
jgi:uncharacterized protein (UPF0335 family)